jgi:hypothetical protein
LGQAIVQVAASLRRTLVLSKQVAAIKRRYMFYFKKQKNTINSLIFLVKPFACLRMYQMLLKMVYTYF